MRLGDFEFSLKELSGALGDFGTLLPLAIGFIAVNGMNPGSFMLVFGISNVATGLIYRAPMPLQPMKAIAAVAIAQRWSPDLITATALSMGLFWLLISVAPGIDEFIARTPKAVVRGIQLALGISLAWTGVSMVLDDIVLLGLVAIAVIVLLNRGGRRGPSALLILTAGVGLALLRGAIPDPLFHFSPPRLALPDLALAWEGFYRGGIAQIPLTFTNAVIACCALLAEYFPRRQVGERHLMANMGVMNVASSLFSGFPMCHGAGGLASQYYFGARTGGANILEGTLEALAGLFLGTAMVTVFSAFPGALVGAMMLMVGIELGKFTLGLDRGSWPVVMATVAAGLYWNLGAGFAVGILVYFLTQSWGGRYPTDSHEV